MNNDKIAKYLEQYSGWVILALLGVTLLLIIPMLTMASDEFASLDPSDEVVELQDDIDQRFSFPIHGNSYIAEARSGDILTQAALWELYQNEQTLRTLDQQGELRPKGLPSQPYLYQGFDTYSSRSYQGVVTIADAVETLMTSVPAFGTSLETATDAQVKLAVHLLLQDPRTAQLRDFFSVGATSQKQQVAGLTIDAWTSPGLVVNVLAENDKLGGGPSRAGLDATDTIFDKEEFDRNVQRVLRGDQVNYRLWGIAIDQNLEAEEEGATAGIFIMFTIVAVMIVVGISLRSYWAMALTGAGLGILMIWLRGISNLMGLKGGSIIELLVPIAMISLGVDFAVHALRRYSEERGNGYAPSMALRVGFAGVLGALALAMLSDGVAFLSNMSSGIESVIHFGAAAGIAVFSSFLVLGVGVPLALSRIDQVGASPKKMPFRLNQVLILLAGGTAAISFAASVILMVAVSQLGGILVLLAAILGVLLLPMFILRRASRSSSDSKIIEASPSSSHTDVGTTLAIAVTKIARFKVMVLALALGITVGAGFLASRLDPQFDVKDFFDSNSDFVVSIDKLDQHIGQLGGEPALFFIEGDLTDPEALAAIDSFTSSLADNRYISKDIDGQSDIWVPNLLSIVRRITSSGYALAEVAGATSVTITDENGDGLPDSRKQLAAVYEYTTSSGVPLDVATDVYSAAEVGRVLSLDPDHNGGVATLLATGLPGSREQTTVKAARLALEQDMRVLGENRGITRFGLTGSPFTREAQLDAATRTLQRSLPIAAVGALVLLLVAMRSVRYAIVTVIPIGLVVAWLYALMYLIGFSLNFVTATIGAVSIGVGIDYSIHMTQRFREELASSPNKVDALHKAAKGTGLALLVSALSSMVGFTIMGLAPFPLISTYGFLTAIMIALALLSSLVVLPSLLLVVAKDQDPTG